MFAFSEDLPESFPAPYRISEQNLRETGGNGWRITSLVQTLYTTSVTRDAVREVVENFRPGQTVDDATAAGLEVDEQGRVRAQVWQLTAQRA
ncbi:hypothetical protein QRX50_44595 [Amycolatopsis carbonis]|uniref:Uncharacterized protein n=1 Tax=Amycolatopsis carbonis TaxID=715471 RepID=A0A9Y2IGX3_9PSEU|nr:hypothetical protein [Amycolatopsis sp. 2-15]WIX78363.1 hypothetical protein QRX50_44595 [Amycolatopsis sp. 2-15]